MMLKELRFLTYIAIIFKFHMFVASDVSITVSERWKDASRNSCDVCRDIIAGTTETKISRDRRFSRSMFGHGTSQIQR